MAVPASTKRAPPRSRSRKGRPVTGLVAPGTLEVFGLRDWTRVVTGWGVLLGVVAFTSMGGEGMMVGWDWDGLGGLKGLIGGEGWGLELGGG